MGELVPDPRRSQTFQTVTFVASAALVALLIRLLWGHPAYLAAVISMVLALWLVRWEAQRRLRRALLAGDVRMVLSRWSRSFRRIPHAATMGPLMTATAFAAYGWVASARAALALAERGPVWEAALEHRLFVDTLLLTFEGNRDAALEQADRLERLPLPPAGTALRGQVRILRESVSALVRAFAHRSKPGDGDLLERAGNLSPLVHWAMRYAAAVVAIDECNWERARNLVANAPAWPTESTFRAFHDEILQQLPAT